MREEQQKLRDLKAKLNFQEAHIADQKEAMADKEADLAAKEAHVTEMVAWITEESEKLSSRSKSSESNSDAREVDEQVDNCSLEGCSQEFDGMGKKELWELFQKHSTGIVLNCPTTDKQGFECGRVIKWSENGEGIQCHWVHHGHGGQLTPRPGAEGIIKKLLDEKSSFVESTKKLHDFVEEQKKIVQKEVEKGKGMEDTEEDTEEERRRRMTGLGNFRVEGEEERGSRDESGDERPTAGGITEEEQPTHQPSDVDENENQDTTTQPTISQANTQKKKGGPLGPGNPTYRPGPDDESSTSEYLSEVVIEEDDILELTAAIPQPPTTTPRKKKPGWKKSNDPTFRPQKGDLVSDESEEHITELEQNKRKNTWETTPKSAQNRTGKMAGTSAPLGRDGKPLKGIRLEPYRRPKTEIAMPEKEATSSTGKRKNDGDDAGPEKLGSSVGPTKKTAPPSAKKQKTTSTSQYKGQTQRSKEISARRRIR